MMKRMSIKIRIISICLLLVMGIVTEVSGISIKATAAQTGSIQVNYLYDNKRTAISGAEFSCVRIADASIDGNSITYRMLEPYDRAKYDPNSPDYGSDTGMAEKYCRLYRKYGDGTASVKTTSSKGICRFGSFVPGLYLIWQSGSEKAAEDYETSTPLVVSVPVNENGKFVYSRAVYPKTTKKAVTEDAGDPGTSSSSETTHSIIEPQPELEEKLESQPLPEIQPEEETTGGSERHTATGDDTHMLLWLGIAGAAAAGAAGYGIYFTHRKRKK